MTYKEVKDFIDSNMKRVDELIRDQSPAKEVRGYLIAPFDMYHNEPMKEYLFKRVVEDGEGNDVILAEKYPHLYLSDKLIAWVVFRMNGNLVTLDMAAYLEGTEAAGKAS
jgi:hypothetical protein